MMSVAPWVPEKPFVAENANAISGLFEVVAEEFPQTREALEPFVEDPVASFASSDLRAPLWGFFMGAQHGRQGVQEGSKLNPTAEQEARLMPQLHEIHYGPHPLVAASPIDTSVEHTHAYVMGGVPIENHVRLRMVPDSVSEIALLTGQRLRGLFGPEAKGERSARELVDYIGKLTGTDMELLASRSDWMRQELAKPENGGGNPWKRPFASEDDIMRLGAEASLHARGLLDPNDVEVEVGRAAIDEPIPYIDRYSEGVVPMRTYELATYPLRTGQKLHVVNSKAVSRPQGVPRATSASAANTAIRTIGLPYGSSLVVVSNAPHIRNGADVGIPVIHTHPGQINRFDIAAAGPVLPNTALKGLGEVLALWKADGRLRAAARGEDPNTAALTAN